MEREKYIFLAMGALVLTGGGTQTGDRLQVLSGLRPGERIVLNPSGLNNNQRVDPKQS